MSVSKLSYVSAPNTLLYRYLSIIDILNEKAAEIPNVAVMIQQFSNGSSKVLTYSELTRKAKTVASFLLSKGIGKGDSVVLRGLNSIEWVIAKMAILMTGAAAVLMQHTQTDVQIIHNLMKSSSCKAIFLDPEEEDLVSGFEEDLSKYREDDIKSTENPLVVLLRRSAWSSLPDIESILSRGMQTVPLPVIQPEHTAVVYMTSGSTGNPKMVEMSHFAVVNRDSGISVHFRQTKVYFCDLPFAWLGSGILNGMCVGYTRFFTDLNTNFEGQNVQNLWKMLHAYNCKSAFFSPNTMIDLIKNKDIIMQTGSKLEVILTGGHKIDHNFREIPAHFCSYFHMVYGTTEIGGIASADLSNTITAGNCGTLFAGVQVKIVGGNGDALPCGEMGDIFVKSPLGFPRFRNDPVRNTQAVTPEGWYRTGDVGSIDQNGRLTLKGRATEVIETGTILVMASEVEDSLSNLSGIQEVCVHAVPSHTAFDEVCASFVLNEGSPLTENDVREFCTFEFGTHVYDIAPTCYVRFNEFPRLPNGKLDRIKIKAEALKGLHIHLP